MTTNEQWKDRSARRLEGKVRAVNKANAEANRLQPLFIEAFRPFVGKKILTHSGLAQKPKEIFEKLAPFVADGYKTPSVYRDQSNYSLRFVVKVAEQNGEHTCCYHEASFHVGELDGYNLKNVFEYDYMIHGSRLRTDHTAEEIRQLRKNLDEAEKTQRAAQSALGPFGRYDQ